MPTHAGYTSGPLWESKLSGIHTQNFNKTIPATACGNGTCNRSYMVYTTQLKCWPSQVHV